MGLLRTTDLVRRHLAALVGRHAITLQQFNVLRILRGAAPRGLPTLEIGERMVEQAPGITRLLDRLEAKGLVSRARCPEDPDARSSARSGPEDLPSSSRCKRRYSRPTARPWVGSMLRTQPG